MAQRQEAFEDGLSALSRRGRKIPSAPKSLYNADHMLNLNEVIQGDCIKLLNAGPDGWADLVFADPPFNIGYLYHGYDDRKKTEDYLQFSHDWMAAVKRALKPTGSFYLAIGDEYAADLCVIARRQLGFNLRNWIIWHYTFGQQTKKMFAKSHTHILYFTMQDLKPNEPMPFTFNPDAVRVASARQTTYADVRANPKGKLPDDVWYLRPQETPDTFFQPDSDTWNVSRVCGTFKEREGWHGCQMPIGVLDRVIKASSNPGDIVLDPFNGSGTTVVSAAMLGRKYVGIDQSSEYCAYARKRLEHTLAQLAAGTAEAPIDAAIDGNRTSRVLTATDAFGRPRVKRGRAGKSMKPAAAVEEDALPVAAATPENP